VDLYKRFRKYYLDKVHTKFRTRLAESEFIENQNRPEEQRHIRTYFQNWGTPEGNRMRPHLTLVYNYLIEDKKTNEILLNFAIPYELQRIILPYIGIIEVDQHGNPVSDGMMYKVPLHSTQ